jgi:hypothetical protein
MKWGSQKKTGSAGTRPVIRYLLAVWLKPKSCVKELLIKNQTLQKYAI